MDQNGPSKSLHRGVWSRRFLVCFQLNLVHRKTGCSEAIASRAADHPEPKRVVMLHSFGPRFKPWSDYAQTIRSEITRQWQKPVDFLDHSLVNARESDENSEAAFVEYLRALYVSRPIDLIVAIG